VPHKKDLIVIILSWMVFVALSMAVLAGPWLFGAWEVWWFWPFTAVICLGAVFTGLRLVLDGAELRSGDGDQESGAGDRRSEVGDRRSEVRVAVVLLSVLPFAFYAIVRWMQADVFMSAERSVLLHLTGLAVAVQVIFGLERRQRKLLFMMVFVNLLLMGIYGIVNYKWWNASHVLWIESYAQYAGRASGSYFCPDHFAGAMELMLCMALAGLLARGVGGIEKLVCGAGIAVAIAGVIMSQSRGGMIAIPLILAAAAVWGVAQWPQEVRKNIRMIAASAALLMFIMLLQLGGKHIDRFASYGGYWGRAGRTKIENRKSEDGDRRSEVGGLKSEVGEVEVAGRFDVIVLQAEVVFDALKRTSRGRMYGGAIRAWKTAPWFGIAPGMHQNLWPQFAATTDGDRELRKWPTLINDYFHSYEVHSDWLQLLEEYGIIGFILFLLPLGMIVFLLFSGIKLEKGLWVKSNGADGDEMRYVYLLSALLALTAMGFHSLGDFNLQMPATVWVLATISALGISAASRR